MEQILYSEFSHGKSTQAHFKKFLKKIKIDHHSLNSQLRSSYSHSLQKKAQPKPLSEESDFDCAFVLQALILHSKATHALLRATSTTSYIGLIYLFLDIFCFRAPTPRLSLRKTSSNKNMRFRTDEIYETLFELVEVSGLAKAFLHNRLGNRQAI